MMHRSNQQLHTLARSLCAAMTALAIILCAFVIPAAAEETSAPIEPAVPAETTVTVETTAAPAETTATPAETTAAPAETTAAPAETTATPAETTATPAETTAAPAETTAEPAETTATPAETTAEPAETTATPAETTATPAETTATPAETTATPAETTAAPAETTAAPAETTAAPAETTAAPAETTATPAETTAEPAETTATPAETTAAPAETTATPAETTATPAETTATPAETTATPAETTAPPAETTAPPAETTAPPAETTAPPAETLAPAETFAPVLQPSDPGMSFAPMQGEPGALESAPLIVDGRAVDEPYQYLVTIEFGSFQFWYDWGEWNVDKLAYTKDASSKDPAADTIDGGPGWYGFDGVTNRIGVTYQAPGGVTENTPWLELSISFVPATVSPDSANRVFNDATSFQFFNKMEKTEVNGQTVITYSQIDAEGNPEDGPIELSATEEGVWAPVELDTIAPVGEEGQVHEYFLSLTGAPHNANNSPFRSANAVSLGLICISIDLVEAPTT